MSGLHRKRQRDRAMTASVVAGITWWAQNAPDQPAIVFDGTDSVDYGTLDRWTDNAAHLLEEMGLRCAERIGVAGENSLEWCVAAIGALKLGAVVVPYNNRFTVPELRHLIDDSDPRLVLGDEEIRPRLTEALTGTGIKLGGLAEFTGLREQPRRRFTAGVTEADDVAIIIYTSGSTAAPKGVLYTHRSMFSFMAELAFNHPEFRPAGRIIYTLSMSGAPGLPWHVLHPLTRGMTLFYERRFDPESTLSRLVDAGIEIMSGVPVQFEQMAESPGFSSADLSSLGLATIAGARVSVETIKVWLDKGVLLRQAYGMTELGGVSTVNTAEMAVRRPESVGRGSIFTKHRVVAPDGTDTAPGERGEIVVRGPSVAPGYWRNPAATEEAMRDGWFHTGDVGVIDADGCIHVVDRMKDLIISGGYNISPSEIEAAIAAVPGVVEVCVISADDPKFGETPAAIVYGPDQGCEVAIVAECERRLAPYKIPRFVVIATDPLPRMVSGKIARRQLRRDYADVAERFSRVR